MLSKRGISPLIATLLLLSFAVALGVVIMQFGRAQVELEAQCPITINIQPLEIAGSPGACLEAGKIRMTLQNGPNIVVTGLVINVIGTESAYTETINTKVEKAGTFVGSVPWQGAVRQLKITPKVVFYEDEEICLEQSIIVEKLPAC